MISRVEVHGQDLLLQRRVLEDLKDGQRMNPGKMWSLLKKVHTESKQGPVKLCSELVVQKPSSSLLARMTWLDGVYRIRNCLAHRLGQVQIVDVKPPGKSLEETSDDDTLKVTWLKIEASVNGNKIESFPHHGGGEMQIHFREIEREWRVGEKIQITADDCQAIAMSLSMLGNQLLQDFLTEMNQILRTDQQA